MSRVSRAPDRRIRRAAQGGPSGPFCFAIYPHPPPSALYRPTAASCSRESRSWARPPGASCSMRRLWCLSLPPGSAAARWEIFRLHAWLPGTRTDRHHHFEVRRQRAGPPASGHSALCNTWPIRLSDQDRLRSNEGFHAEPVDQRARHGQVIKTRAQFRGRAYFLAGFQSEHTTGGGLRSLITGVRIRAADTWLLEKWIQADTRPPAASS